MRRKTIRLIEAIDSKGVFGRCSCGGEVLYYTDQGVRCSTCGKLYGVWSNRSRALIKRSQELLMQTQKFAYEDYEDMGMEGFEFLPEEEPEAILE